jgi:two-component system cell cycle sensor histidine kinase/response regulator CckA
MAHEDEAAYQLLFDLNPTPLWVFDAGTLDFLAVNEAAIQYYGYSRDEFLAMKVRDVRPPEDRQRFLEYFATFERTARPHPVGRWHHQKKDGTIIDVEIHSTSLTFAGKSALLSLMFDVTERTREEEKRRAIEEALRRSEASFRSLVEHLPIGVLVHRKNRVVYANPALLTLLGYARLDELLDRAPLDLVAPDQHEMIRARIDRLRELPVGALSGPLEERLLKRDGSVIVAEIEGLRVDLDGGPSIMVLARDLTERRQMLARLAVADRMASVGTLAAGVAHEINNPLAYVVANLNVLADELPPLLQPGAAEPHLTSEQIASLIKDAREGAARVQAVVRDLRMVSRADDEVRGPVDVRAVLQSSVKLATNEIRHRARLVEEYGAVPPVDASESRLGQVFLNLLINAAHAIEDGHAARNVIRVVTRADGPEQVVVEVHDTGRGIPRENLGRVFDPFFTTKPVGEGTGLGLSICHGIVKSLGGTINVENDVGGGTVFRVTLPASKGRVPSARPLVPARPALPRGRILIVDDEPSMGTSLRILLSPEHDVVTVTRGRHALALIEDGEKFDAILCDLMMPEMGGMDLFAALERVAPELASRVVFLTGGAFTERAAEFLANVKNPTLDKPFAVDDLRAALGRVMR